MAIKAKTVYTTTDGKEHPSRSAAMKHEAGFKVRTALEEQFQKLSPNRTPDQFSLNLITNPKALEEMRDMCNKGLEYHRNHGLLRKAK